MESEITIEGDLPGSGIPKTSQIELRERWMRAYRDQPWRLTEYSYELLDQERGVRLALHLHDTPVFIDRYRVVVHEHCESPIGQAACHHYAGVPVADGFQAVDRLLGAWLSDTPPDCSDLICLDAMQP